MSFIGDFFHGVGNLISGHSWGHKDNSQQWQQQAAPQAAPTVVNIPTPQVAAPMETPAAQQGQQGAKPTISAMTPSFLAAAALPDQQGRGTSLGAPNTPVPAGGLNNEDQPFQSNPGGKSLVGQ